VNNDTLFRLMLARDLGKTLAELDAALGPGELDFWRAFYERERARQRSGKSGTVNVIRAENDARLSAALDRVAQTPAERRYFEGGWRRVE
jgi:hypothetical protein